MAFVVMWAYIFCWKNIVSTCHASWIIRIGDVPLIFMVPSTIYWSSKGLLAGCTPHCTLCRMELHFHVYVVSQRPRTSFSNFMFINPFEVEMGWFSNLHAVWSGYCMMSTLVHSVCCVYVCMPLTFLQQMEPPFILPISQLSHVFMNTLCLPCLLIWALWI